MEILKCKKGCCSLKINKYDNKLKNSNFKFKRRRHKAGVFFYDSSTNKVLLIQSRGHLWGPPKGTIKYGETERECAIREVREETGLKITFDNFTKATSIKKRAMYFFVEKKECDVNIQETPNNDANGITWIKIECLIELIKNGNISITQHCRIVFYRFLKGIILPHSTFKLVKRKQN